LAASGAAWTVDAPLPYSTYTPAWLAYQAMVRASPGVISGCKGLSKADSGNPSGRSTGGRGRPLRGGHRAARPEFARALTKTLAVAANVIKSALDARVVVVRTTATTVITADRRIVARWRPLAPAASSRRDIITFIAIIVDFWCEDYEIVLVVLVFDG